MKGYNLKNEIRLIMTLVIMAGSLPCVSAQKVALKTNLLYDALLTPDLGLEVKVAPQWTLELTGNLNAWNVNDRRWRQWSAQPEARFWFCRAFSGHFIGVHALGGQYNFGNLPFNFKFLGTDFRQLRDSRLQGWMAGAGLAYGYSWILDKHWNLEAELGIGWLYTRYDKYPCGICGTKIESGTTHNYFGPTKAALNLIYVF